jgi:hypothetical protein
MYVCMCVYIYIYIYIYIFFRFKQRVDNKYEWTETIKHSFVTQ